MWIDLVPTAVLLLAAVLRLCSLIATRRYVALALVAAALAWAIASGALLERPAAPAGWLIDVLDLAWLLLVTVAAAAVLAVARRVALHATALSWPPTAVGLSIALLQVVLFVAAAGQRGPQPHSVLALATLPETTALWLATLGGPVAAGAALLPALWAYGPGITHLAGRFGVRIVICGLLLLGVAGGSRVVHLVLAYVPAVSGTTAFVAASEVVGGSGLVVVAAGFLVPRLASALEAPRKLIRAWLAVRRLAQLADDLVAAAPEWAARRAQFDTGLHPTIRLYREVIRIRDTSWTLLASVDDTVVAQAVAFARRQSPSLTEHAIAALAEACWLRQAVRVRRSGQVSPYQDHEVLIFDRATDEDDGSLDSEVKFLLAVARAWRDGQLVDRFLATLDGHPVPGQAR